MKTKQKIGLMLMAVIFILQLLGLLPPILLVIGGVIGIYLFLKGSKKEDTKKDKNETSFKIINDNNGVSEVIGGIMLLMIVVGVFTTITVISNQNNANTMEINKRNNANTIIAFEMLWNETFNQIRNMLDNSTQTTPTTPEDTNNKPTAFNPWPLDQAINIPIKPILRITVQDLDRDNLVIEFYYYNLSLKRYARINNEKIEGFTGQIITCNFTQCTENCQYYNWYVKVKDSESFYITPVYAFKTEALHSP